jgi:hypothetical protein
MPVHRKSPRKSPLRMKMSPARLLKKSPLRMKMSPARSVKKSPLRLKMSPARRLKKSPLRMRMCSMRMEPTPNARKLSRKASNSKPGDYIANLHKDFPELDIESIPLKKLFELAKNNERRRESMLKMRMAYRSPKKSPRRY